MSVMDQDWADAINEEYGTDFKPDVDEDEDELDDEQEDTQDTQDIEDEGDSEDDSNSDDDDSDDSEDSDDEEEADEESDDADEEAEDDGEQVEKFATKDDIKAALRELDAEKQSYATDHKAMQEEVLDKLFPEGVDRVLRDSDGDPINGIDDLTGLINPKTGDLFTEEEAGRWLLESQQKLNQDIQQLEDYASEIVDTNISLKDGSERVNELYGDLLTTIPDMAEKLLEAYSNTLVRDPKTGIVIKAPVDVLEFYSMALAPYKDVAEQAAAKAEAERQAAKEQKSKQDKANQSERSDLKQRGKSKLPKSEDEEAWDDAYDDYFNS